MLNMLSIDMKTPNIRDFPQKYTVQAFYVQNTPKTWDIWCNFSKKLGYLPFCVQILTDFNIPVGETQKNQDFPQL